MDDRDEAPGLITSEECTLRSLIEALSGHGRRMAVVTLREECVERWSYVELSDNVRRWRVACAGQGLDAATTW